MINPPITADGNYFFMCKAKFININGGRESYPVATWLCDGWQDGEDLPNGDAVIHGYCKGIVMNEMFNTVTGGVYDVSYIAV